jgi:CYTH domain-containing protein
MTIERERKFLVKTLIPRHKGKLVSNYIEQAYLCTANVSVRVRVTDGVRAELCVKWAVGEEDVGLNRHEFHFPIDDVDKAYNLFNPAVGTVRKVRVTDGCWEFDHFREVLSPLVVAEIELPEGEEEWPEELPEPENHELQLGPEVTHRTSYRNDRLATWGLPHHFTTWWAHENTHIGDL